MAIPRHLRKAPITEALFDVRVKTRTGFDAQTFLNLKSQLSARYPHVNEHRGVEMEFRREDMPKPRIQDLGMRGVFFRSNDRTTIAQFRIDGFTFNRLSPYTSWEELFPEFLGLWDLYRQTAEPERAVRLAVRYINRIPIPIGERKLERFLVAPPMIPADLPQDMRGFLSRITLVEPFDEFEATVAQALEPTVSDVQAAIILDVDVHTEGSYPVAGETIAELFKRFREFKNRVFFSFLKEDTIKEFE
jgi:uncharacterized protein (TIGR04255 family)